MAQQFTRDAQMLAADVNVVTTAETVGPITNALPIPYQNGKVAVRGSVIMVVGTGTTSIKLQVRRNPAGENVIVNPSPQLFTAVAGNVSVFPFDFTDSIPDGRSVIYEVTVTQGAATGNGTIKAGSYIEATILSG